MAFLQSQLRLHFGESFPVGSGSTTEEDPLIITELLDYVAVEYAVARHLLDEMGVEYKFQRQASLKHQGRLIDELVYEVKRPGSQEPAKLASFFFDNTAGRTHVHVEEEGPEEDDDDDIESWDIGGPPIQDRSQSSNHISTETKSLKHHLWLGIRWIIFLPAAYISSLFGTRIFVEIDKVIHAGNPYVFSVFASQIASGALIGWVGLKISPSPKIFAWFACTILSAFISLAYYRAFSDMLGASAALVGLVSTMAAGFFVLVDDYQGVT